jgi:hypothetical protein
MCRLLALNLEPGDVVKIRRETDVDLIETFWVVVQEVHGPWLEGKVSNELVGNRFAYGDWIRFSEIDVIDIHPE